jgi:NADPH:quinone reductase-like Zn-dependent oxidoreductase
MRQIWITKAGPPEVLEVREAPDPEAGDGEVRIRVRAAGINFADLMARVGLYPDAPKVPCVVGYEVSGVVDAIGSNVRSVAVGDRVFPLCQRDLRQLPLDISVPMGGEWFLVRAQAFPDSRSFNSSLGERSQAA